MTKTIRALVLDDEPFSQEILCTLLGHEIPGMEIEGRTEPDPKGEFDIYIIDNDFGGVAMAAELARTIRAQQPTSLVLAFSGTLDAMTLKELINAGCDGVCDKSVDTDLPIALDIVRKYVDSLVSEPDPASALPSGGGLFGAIRSISDLLREWNTRLETQQRGLDSADR